MSSMVRELPLPPKSLTFKFLYTSITRDYEKTLTMHHVLFFNLLLSCTSFLIGTVFGFNLGLSSSVLPTIASETSYLQTNATTATSSSETAGVNALLSLFPALYTYGTPIGSLIFPLFVNKFGYKWIFVFLIFFIIICQIICALSSGYIMLIIVRFFYGIFTGGLQVIGTGYCQLSSSRDWRGLIGSMVQLGVSSWLCVANITGYFALIPILGTWRYMLWIGLSTPFLLFSLTLILPEASVWRLERRIARQLKVAKLSTAQRYRKLFCSAYNLWLLFLAFLLILSYMFGGFYFAIVLLSFTLEAAGITSVAARTSTIVAITAWNAFVILVAASVISLAPRKLFLTIGYVIMFFSTLTIGFLIFFVPPPTGTYITIGVLCIFLLGNNFGVGSLVFFISYELFDKEVALIAGSVLYPMFTITAGSAGIILFQILPFVGLSGLFWLSCGVIAIIGPILILFLPETSPKYNRADFKS